MTAIYLIFIHLAIDKDQDFTNNFNRGWVVEFCTNGLLDGDVLVRLDIKNIYLWMKHLKLVHKRIFRYNDETESIGIGT